MGVVRCGTHGVKCCWRCDRCPTCKPETGKLKRGDYCADCTAKNKAEGLVWSESHKNWVTPKMKADFAEYLAQEKLFQAEHANDYLVLSAFGDWHKDVPKDYVGVFAGKGGRTPEGHFPADTKWFLVPKADYKPKMVLWLGTFAEIAPLS